MSRVVLPPSGVAFLVFGWLFAVVGFGCVFSKDYGLSAILFLAACIFWAAGGIINALGGVVRELRAAREPDELA